MWLQVFKLTLPVHCKVCNNIKRLIDNKALEAKELIIEIIFVAWVIFVCPYHEFK